MRYHAKSTGKSAAPSGIGKDAQTKTPACRTGWPASRVENPLASLVQRISANSPAVALRCWRRTNGSQPLIADLTSLPLSQVHALALAGLRISIMRGNLLQMTLTDSSQSVTLRASKPSD